MEILISVLAAAAIAAVLFQIDAQAGAQSLNVPTTTETLVATSSAVSTPNPNGKAVITVWCQLQVGSGTTAVQIAVYAGNAIGGRVVGSKQSMSGGFAPGGIAQFAAEFLDPFSNTGQVQYCFSVLQTGATGAGTVLNSIIETKVLSG